jgi:regulator of sigma E protease
MIITLVAFFAVLGLLVLVHEAGHFFVARKLGVKVEEFGFGLPPRIFVVQILSGKVIKPVSTTEEIDVTITDHQVGDTELIESKVVDRIENIEEIKSVKKWRFIWRQKHLGEPGQPGFQEGTVYSLNWIPLGGFVKIKGEQGESAEETDSFGYKKVWQRILIISAGVFMNVILAMVLLSISLAIGSPQTLEDRVIPKVAKVSNQQVIVYSVLADSPASQAGLSVGDTVVKIDGQTFDKIEDLQNYINGKVGTKISLEVERKKEKLIKELTPQVLEETKKGGVGVALIQTATISYPWYVAWWYGIIEVFKMIGWIIYSFYFLLKNLIFSGELAADVYGPVGIASMVGDAARLGLIYLLQFTATLSTIIAVINFLPFPALDGGRVVFLFIEGIRKKAVNQRIENLVHNVGFMLLMFLILLVTLRDINRVSSGLFTKIWQGFTNIF